ncbi:MAG: hypothetical protein ABIJ26_08340, partial [Candidatus Margulisiibacteriota bacterium]
MLALSLLGGNRISRSFSRPTTPVPPSAGRPAGASQLETLKRLIGSGVRDRADLNQFLELFRPRNFEKFFNALPAVGRMLPDSLKEAEKLGLYVSNVVGHFERYNIPVHFVGAEEGSCCNRQDDEFIFRESFPAKQHGIFIAQGASLLTVLHEMTHAIPSTKIFGELLEVFSIPNPACLQFPNPPSADDRIEETFIKLTGASFRDEAYSGISVVILDKFFGAIDLPRSEQKYIFEAEKMLFTQSVLAYVNSGVYLGNNH